MKKLFLLFGAASMLLACNSASDQTPTHDSTSHHMDTTASLNPIAASMDKMMQQMHASKPTGNNEVDFASMMLEHHRGAVEMSQIELDKGSDVKLKEFAGKVIADQNKEIAFMQDFIGKAAKTPSPNSADFQKAMSASMMAMMSSDRTSQNNIDKDYVTEMIPHHQSAVDMAKAYLKYGKETSLVQLCNNIISSQEKEINWLRQWLTGNAE